MFVKIGGLSNTKEIKLGTKICKVKDCNLKVLENEEYCWKHISLKNTQNTNHQ